MLVPTSCHLLLIMKMVRKFAEKDSDSPAS